MKILQQITKALTNKMPFVAYRKAGYNYLSAFFQKDSTLHLFEDSKNKGFVFAPFNDTEQTIFLPEDQCTYCQENIQFDIEKFLQNKAHPINVIKKEEHITLVNKGIEAIKTNQYKKIVLSRKEHVAFSDSEITIFKRLISQYTNAFVYMWYHPEIGLWLGATPETLVKVKGKKFETMSLAGTQPYKGDLNVNWGKKELEEQEMVTQYVLSQLTPLCESITTNKVNTIKAGSLLHLQTKIKGVLKNNNLTLIPVLHPTPAVCGYPKEGAKALILDQENYNRKYYTGFLGEINMHIENSEDLQTELFVNLRCMELHNNMATIYIGGGITKDSIPEKEWEETVAKSSIMKRVLS